MKRLILAVVGVGALIGLALSINRSKIPPAPAVETVAESNPDQTMERVQPVKAVVAATQFRQSPADRSKPAPVPLSRFAATDDALAFNHTIEMLVSPQASFEQKQAAWKQLKEMGKLDQAISDLEQRTADEPQKAEYAAALGQAYLKKCALIQDVREQALLAMKADQTFDVALGLDPSNWEARYTKAVGMSYWPAQLNKGQEVIEQFAVLIQQQEAQPSQPQFARSYLWLGDQYRKTGYPEYAAQVWQRGAALFPNNEELKNKLASAPSQP